MELIPLNGPEQEYLFHFNNWLLFITYIKIRGQYAAKSSLTESYPITSNGNIVDNNTVNIVDKTMRYVSKSCTIGNKLINILNW